MAHLSKNSRYCYLLDLCHFLKAVYGEDSEAGLRRFLSLTAKEAKALVDDYRMRLKLQGRKASSINRYLAAIETTLVLLHEAGLAEWTLRLRREKQRTDPVQRVAQRLPSLSPERLASYVTC